MTKKLTFKEINKTEVDIPETDSNMLRRLEYDEVKKKKKKTSLTQKKIDVNNSTDPPKLLYIISVLFYIFV